MTGAEAKQNPLVGKAFAGRLLGSSKRYIFHTMITFEFDPAKSAANLAKHGIDFIAAQAIWQDADFIEIKARSDDEPRFLVVGMIDHKHWSAIITYRGEVVRIISVRRSRDSEVALYES